MLTSDEDIRSGCRMCAEHLETSRRLIKSHEAAWASVEKAYQGCGDPSLRHLILCDAIDDVVKRSRAKGADDVRDKFDPMKWDELREENERLRAALRALLGRG